MFQRILLAIDNSKHSRKAPPLLSSWPGTPGRGRGLPPRGGWVMSIDPARYTVGRGMASMS
jgi:hypothetical protein